VVRCVDLPVRASARRGGDWHPNAKSSTSLRAAARCPDTLPAIVRRPACVIARSAGRRRYGAEVASSDHSRHGLARRTDRAGASRYLPMPYAKNLDTKYTPDQRRPFAAGAALYWMIGFRHGANHRITEASPTMEEGSSSAGRRRKAGQVSPGDLVRRSRDRKAKHGITIAYAACC